VRFGLTRLNECTIGVPSYCLSKLALNGITIMLAEGVKEYGIAVNSMFPGWVRTDMGGSSAPRCVEEGADTAVWLATEADPKVTGRFSRGRKEIGW
jgi:NAD(P)-dependent dehydrogenase (short-subunit alcohol dehydrogenase family)